MHPALPQKGPPSTVLHRRQDRFIEGFLDWSTTLRSGFVSEGLDFLERCRPRSRCGGAREAMLCLWTSLYEELVHGWGCSRPAAPRAIERRERNRWNAAACLELELICSPSSSSFSRSAWYAWSTVIVWRHAPAWPAAAYPLPNSADDPRSGLVGKTGAFRDDAAPGAR